MGWTYRLASATKPSLARMQQNFEKLRKAGKTLSHFTPSLYLVQPTPEEAGVVKNNGRISTDKKPFDKFEDLEKYVTGKK